MQNQSIISVKNLIKRYHKAKVNAVDSISFEVAQGELFAFLGPNGAGKTTTISILTTSLSKTSGEVNIAGFDIERESSSVRQSIGVIFQQPSLDTNLTAEENVRFHCILYGIYPFRLTYGMMPKEYKTRIMQMAELLGIQKEVFKPIKTFSGGMKRKLEIIRSLMHKPKVLFLDEPTEGLDPLSRKTLWEYLQQIRQEEKTTIFLTTHYLEEANDAERICIINQGKIVSLGTVTELKNTLVKEYVKLIPEDLTKLEQELKTKKLEASREGKGMVINLNPNLSAQSLIKSIDTKLIDIEIHTPTLEEAYIEIISNTSKS